MHMTVVILLYNYISIIKILLHLKEQTLSYQRVFFCIFGHIFVNITLDNFGLVSNTSKANSIPISIGHPIICSNNTKWNGKISSELLPEDCFSFELTSGWKDHNQK